MADIAANIARVRARIATAAARSGRRADSVLLVAVTKSVGLDQIREAVAAGLRVFGENRVQEARDKIPLVPEISWHLVGSLQRNKVKEALQLFHLIHSVDSLPLAEEISRRALLVHPNSPADILIQVNISAEPQKHGIALGGAADLVARVRRLPGVRVRGLMGIAPPVEEPGRARPYFTGLRDLRDRVNAETPDARLNELSMGMTDDFEVAIEEGATMVRIGRALFA